MNKIPLWEKNVPFWDESIPQTPPYLTPYLPSPDAEKKRGAIIICPGGSYVMKADHEGKSAAELFSKRGYTCFLLDYRVYPYGYEAIRADINRAVRWVRYHADEYGFSPDKIALMGFSAGGHLAAMGATCYDMGRDDGDEIDRTSCRPDASVPCYAVISLTDDFAHDHTRFALLGKAPCENRDELRRAYSPHLAADSNTPPMFLWHTAEDNCVDVENSIAMAASLSRHKVPFELHVFDKGPHSIGVDESFPGAGQWVALFENWITRLGF